MFASFLRGLGVFLLATLLRPIQLLETDGDNRGSIDPNG